MSWESRGDGVALLTDPSAVQRHRLTQVRKDPGGPGAQAACRGAAALRFVRGLTPVAVHFFLWHLEKRW